MSRVQLGEQEEVGGGELISRRQAGALAGHGVVQSGAFAELRALAEKTDTPVVTTLLGISAIPESHPLCLGMAGMHGMYWANRAMEEADLVVAVGMRFDDRIASKPNSFAPKAKIVHVDIDLNEMGRNVRVDVPIVGDARAVLGLLVERAREVRHPEWLAQLAAWRAEGEVANGNGYHEKPSGPEVIRTIRRVTGGDALVASDVGQHLMWVAQHFCFDVPGSFYCSGGLGSMGYGLPAAMGAKVARPEMNVWAVVGDGGFQMSAPELSTLAQHQVGVKIALLNNGYLGMVRQWQQFFFESNYSHSPIPGPDFVSLAKAHGVASCRVETPEGVEPAIRLAMAQGPFLVEFMVGRGERFPYGSSRSEPWGNDAGVTNRGPGYFLAFDISCLLCRCLVPGPNSWWPV